MSSFFMLFTLLINYAVVSDSSVKGVGSDEEEELNMKQEIVVDDEKVMGWAKVCLTRSSLTKCICWPLF